MRKARQWEAEKLVAPVVLAPGGALYFIDRHHLVCEMRDDGLQMAPVRQIADHRPRLLVHATGQEAFQLRAVLVQDADGGVPGACRFARLILGPSGQGGRYDRHNPRRHRRLDL